MTVEFNRPTPKMRELIIVHMIFQLNNTLIEVVLASQSSLFQEKFQDKKFSPDPVTPRIFWVKNVRVSGSHGEFH